MIAMLNSVEIFFFYIIALNIITCTESDENHKILKINLFMVSTGTLFSASCLKEK